MKTLLPFNGPNHLRGRVQELVPRHPQSQPRKANSLLPAELDPLLGVVGLLIDDIPAVVRVIVAQRQERVLQRLGAGARQSYAQHLHGLVAPAGWWLGHGVDMVFEEPDEKVIHGWHFLATESVQAA